MGGAELHRRPDLDIHLRRETGLASHIHVAWVAVLGVAHGYVGDRLVRVFRKAHQRKHAGDSAAGLCEDGACQRTSLPNSCGEACSSQLLDTRYHPAWSASGLCITGSFLVEFIFSVPGLGKYYVSTVSNRDYSVVMGLTVLLSALVVAANLVVDILYGVLDPRIRND